MRGTPALLERTPEAPSNAPGQLGGRLPGRLREVIRPDFKKEVPAGDREALLDHPQYRRLDMHIRRLMSEEGTTRASPVAEAADRG